MTATGAIAHPGDPATRPAVTACFDEPANTVRHVVKDPASSARALVDPVTDIDQAAGRIIAGIREHGLGDRSGLARRDAAGGESSSGCGPERPEAGSPGLAGRRSATHPT